MKNAQSLNSSIICKCHGFIAEMETMLQLCCDNQVRVKNGPVDQDTVCYQAKLMFKRLKEKTGDTAKDEKFVMVGSVDLKLIAIGTASRRGGKC